MGEIVVAVRARRSSSGWRRCWRQEFRGSRVRVVEGGNSRQESVENALRSLGPEYELVAVHDAVRPFIDLETIHKVFDEAAETGAAIVGRARGGHGQAGDPRHRPRRIRATLPREKLVMAQTPQVFRYDLLVKRAFESARAGRFHRHRRIQHGGAAGRGGERRAGQRPQHQDHQAHRHGPGAPFLHEETARNAVALSEIRTGLGWDVHRIAAGRPLILGGVTVPCEFGLEGHSDADVLAHAITDAILGAAALGDIGMHFPDTDPRWKGCDSLVFLRHAQDLAASDGLPHRECGFDGDPGAAEAEGLSARRFASGWRRLWAWMWTASR